MGILKAYNRQVGRSAEIGAVADDIGLSGSGMRSLGGAATSIATNYMQKMEAETTASQVADAEAKTITAWSVAQQHMRENGDPIEMEKIYNKFESDHKKELAETKLTKRARANIDNSAKTFFAKRQADTFGNGGIIDVAHISNLDKPYIEGSSNALLGLYDENRFDSATEAYENNINARVNLGTVSFEEGTKLKTNFEATSNYTTRRRNIAESGELYAMDGDGKEYIKRLNDIRNESESLKMKTSSKDSLYTEIGYKLANVMGKENRKAATLIEGMKNEIKLGEFDYDDSLKIEKQLGAQYSQLISDAKEEALRDLAVTDADARKAVKTLNLALNGNDKGVRISWTEARRGLDSRRSSTKIVASMVLADNYVEQIGVQGNIVAYEGWFRSDKTVPSTGFYADVTKEIAYYAKTPSGDASFINGAWADAMEWKSDQKDGKGMYDGEYVTKDEFFSKRFNKIATQEVQSMVAPQVQSKGGFVVGKTYTDANGNKAMWNGESWQGVE